MAITLVQVLGQAQSKTAGTSLVIPVGQTVTVGNTMFLSLGMDYVAADPTVTDTLGNTWSLIVRTSNGTSSASILYAAPVTTGGNLTSVTVSHSSLTARVATVAEFSGVGSLRSGKTGGYAASNVTSAYGTPGVNGTSFATGISGDLWIGAFCCECDTSETLSAFSPIPGAEEVGSDIGTTGGGAASNIVAAMTYWISDGSSTRLGMTKTASGRAFSGAGAAFQPAVSSTPTSSSDSSSISISEDKTITVSISTSDTGSLAISGSSSVGSSSPQPAYQGVATASVASAAANVVITTSDLGTVSNGDLLIAYCTANNTTATWSATGWTNYFADSSIGSAFLYRIADGTEGSTITFTRSASLAAAEVTVIRISNPDPTTPLDASALTSGSGANLVLPSITVGAGNALVFEIVTRVASGAGQSWTPPAGVTERFDLDSPTNTLRVAGGDESVTAGPTSTRTWVQSGTGATRGGIIAITAPTDTGPVSKSASDTAAITITSYASKPNLQTFREALANRESARVNIGMLGCSLMEGYPATADKTPAQYLAKRLRARYPTSGNPGGQGRLTIPTAAMVGITPFTITPGTSGAVGTSNPASGWGANHQTWFTNGSLAVPPILVCTIPNAPWTSFDIDLLRVQGYSTTAGKYRIDGGSWVNFSLAPTGGTGIVNEKLHVSSTVNSTIEVTIETGNAGSFVIVNGITGYNGDESKGIQAHAFGHSGYKVNQWRVDANPTYGFRYDQALEDLDLLIISDLGVNDAQALSSAQFATDLADFFTYLAEVHSGLPVVMVSAYDMTAGVSYVEPWTNYRDVMKNFAVARGIQFIDLMDSMPATPNSIYYTDNTHGNTNGDAYSLMADIIAFAITGLAADTAAITITESSSVQMTTTPSGTESTGITISESASVLVSVSVSDTKGLRITEQTPNQSWGRLLTSASLSTLTDDFNDNVISDKWVLSPANSPITEVGGVLQVGNGSNTGALISNQSYVLRNSELVFQIPTIATGMTDGEIMVESNNGPTPVSFYFQKDGPLSVTINKNNYTSNASYAWNHATDTWVKIAFSDDANPVITTSVSSDGNNWSMLDSFTSTSPGTNGRVWIALWAGNNGYTLDNINNGPSVITKSASDSVAITITESSNAGTSTPGNETTGLGITDTSSVLVTMTRPDTGAVTITDASTTAIQTNVAASESEALTITESKTLAGSSTSTDTSAISIADISSLAILTAVSASDTAAITITEVSNAGASLPGTDTIAVGIVDSSSTLISISTSDSSSVSISEAKTTTAGIIATESSSVSISDSSATTRTLVTSDTSSVSIASVVTDGVSSTRSDTSSVSIADSSSSVQTLFLAAAETSSVSIGDLSSSALTVSRTDTGAVSIAETTSGANTVGTSDTSSVSIIEVSNANSSLPGAETTALGIVESTSIVVVLPTSDTSGVVITDSSGSALGLTRTDTSSISIDDTSASNLTNQATDTSSVSISSSTSTSIFTLVSSVDALGLYFDDSSAGFADTIASDTSGIGMSENTSGAQDNTIDGTDSASVVIDEVTTIDISVVGTDTASLGVTESTNSLRTIPTSDTSSVSITEMVGLNQNADLPGTDSTAVGMTESTVIVVVFGDTDSGGIGVDDVSSESVTVATSETNGLVITEDVDISGTVNRTEAVGLGITDTSTLSISAVFGSTDSSGMAVSETSLIQITQSATDDLVIEVDDSGVIVTGSGVTTSDTTSLAISDHGVISDLLPRQPNVYINGEWNAGVFKVYHNGVWSTYAVKLFENGIWT